jgi:putative ABC transport system ATP-binding protein
MGVFQSLNEKGITIVMVTHELDIASFSKRKVVMRDGVILSDEPVLDRLKASEEQAKLDAEQKAVQLT